MTSKSTTQQWVKSSYSDNGGSCVAAGASTFIFPVMNSQSSTIRASTVTDRRRC
ncbi:DUF397 domain-containing protein [Streptomyces anulatus]